MIDNIGIDIVDNERMNNLSPSAIEMILSDKELEIFNKKKGKKRLEYLCGRFTAKEAIIKALNKYENPHMKEITILNKKNGAPYTIYKKYNILISISHEDKYTISEAILLK